MGQLLSRGDFQMLSTWRDIAGTVRLEITWTWASLCVATASPCPPPESTSGVDMSCEPQCLTSKEHGVLPHAETILNYAYNPIYADRMRNLLKYISCRQLIITLLVHADILAGPVDSSPDSSRMVAF